MVAVGPGVADPSIVVRLGEVVAGKFRIERVLGEGGAGVVFEATHLQLEQRVALKFLRREAMFQPEVVERFALEARAAVKLKSEHVARVLDVGEHGKLPYMVMEFLEGKDLEELLVERQCFPAGEAAELIIQAAEGISEAHARGIVHRDIKPANLFLAQPKDGWDTLKVLDFGISKAALTGASPNEALASGKTVSMVGSPYYMSPEQIRSSRDVDHRTDVWSLGTVLFELVTGQTAFASSDFGSLMAEILDKPHRRLRALRPDAPPELEEVIDRCLAKDPAARFRSAAGLAVELLAFTPNKRARVTVSRAVGITRAAGIDPDLPLPSTMPPRLSGPISLSDSGSIPDLRVSPPPAFSHAPEPTSVSHAPQASVGRRGGALVGGAAAVVALLLLAGFAATRGTSDAPAAEAEPPAAMAEPPFATPPPGWLEPEDELARTLLLAAPPATGMPEEPEAEPAGDAEPVKPQRRAAGVAAPIRPVSSGPPAGASAKEAPDAGVPTALDIRRER
jgi:serine/threonine protein kinase